MNNERGCGCYAIHFMMTSIAIQHDITQTYPASPNQNTIYINLFSSNEVIKLHLSLYLSPNIVLSQLDIAAPGYFNIVEAIQHVVGYINRN